MNPLLRHALLASTLALLPATAHAAADPDTAATAAGPAETAPAADDQDRQDSDVVVTGVLEEPARTATGLALSPRETPQSITVIERERIKDFVLTNVNDLLDQTVGINVERVETDRTYFNSRGFDITNFQVDGIGLPLLWGIQFGDLDTALFERVEAIRGANALMTGVGNPSATINYVRKRPTQDLQASASAEFGSWKYKRVEGDLSVPLTDTLGIRLVAAHEDRDSYLDYNHVNRTVLGAIASWEVTPGLTATAGYTRQVNNADGVMWGALPLTYSDGTRIDYKPSATTSADWTFWNVRDQTAFGELAYKFGGGWEAKGTFTYRRFEELSKLLYAFGFPDKATGLGVGGMSGIYPSKYDQYLGDFNVSGPIHLFGRKHELAFGVSTARSDALEWENFSETFPDYPAVQDWGRVQVAEPDYPGAYLAADYTDRITRAYGAAHFNFADNLKVIAGASATWVKSTGTSYGTDQSRNNSGVSPYAGAILDVTPNVSLYASYTGIFNPQSEVDIDNRKLDPARGVSMEAGVKSEWLGGRLYATASVFRSKQKGLANPIADNSLCVNGPIGTTCYEGVDTTSRGFEFEVAGKITDNWTLSGGYTGLEIHDESGAPARIWLPTKSLKLATTYTVPQLNDLKFGAQLRWQNTVRYLDTTLPDFPDGVLLKQPGYAIVDLMAGIRLLDRVRVSVNVRNLTDRKYLGSLMWGQAFYAAPRSAYVSVSFQY